MNAKDIQAITPQSPKTTKPRPPQKITRKQKAMVDALMSDKNLTQAEAYKMAYNVKPDASKSAIDVEASRTLKKPSVVSYLANYNNLVENTILNTVNEWGTSENTRQREIAINSAMFIHDKIHGKATTNIKQSTEVVQISINLTGDSDHAPIDL